MLKKRFNGLTGARTSHTVEKASTSAKNPHPLSQRTVSLMIQLYEFIYNRSGPFRVLGSLLDTDFLHDGLFAIGFPKEFLDRCAWSYYWNFRELLPALFDGTFFDRWTEGGGARNPIQGQEYLRGFATFLCGLFRYRAELASAFEQRAALDATLEKDGYSFAGGRLVETRKATIDEPKELQLVEQLIGASVHDDKEVLLHHFENGQKLFEDGKFHPCAGEWRSFLEGMLRGIWRLTRNHRSEFATYSATPSMKDVFLFLHKAGFFDADEEQAFRSSYGFLSAGGHPGISEKDDAYLAQILALTFGHALLLKLASWDTGRYKHFT